MPAELPVELVVFGRKSELFCSGPLECASGRMKSYRSRGGASLPDTRLLNGYLRESRSEPPRQSATTGTNGSGDYLSGALSVTLVSPAGLGACHFRFERFPQNPQQMTEIWLTSNRRVLLMAMLPVGLLGALSLAVLGRDAAPLFRLLAMGCLMIAVVLLLGLLLQLFRPRIAYRDGHVLFYLRARRPIAVPVQVVEAFFLGQGPAHLPVTAGNTKTVNLVARLSQRATEWAHQDVKSALGQWCDGYVTIRGTWCEPLTGDLIRRLNRRLHEVSRLDEHDESEART